MKRCVLIISFVILSAAGAFSQDFSKLEGLFMAGKIEKCITKGKKFKQNHPNSPVPYFYDFKCYSIKLTGSNTPFTFRENLYNTLIAAEQLKERDNQGEYLSDISEELELILEIAREEVAVLESEEKEDKVQLFNSVLAEFGNTNFALEKKPTYKKGLSKGSSPDDTLVNTSSDHTAPVNMREQLSIVSESLVGTPYRYGGMDPNGFDCSGFTSYVFSACALQIPRTSAAQSSVGKEIDLDHARKGDLLFFGTKNRISHVALVVSAENEPLRIIHSTSSKGVISHTENDGDWQHYWSQRLLFARRVIN